MRAKRVIFIIGLCILAVIIGYVILAIKAEYVYRRIAIVNDTPVLLQLLSDWEKGSRPSGQETTKLTAKYESPFKSYKAYLFTNTVQVNGTNYSFIFGIRDSRFATNETLAVTSEGVVILVSGKGNQIVYSKH